MNEILLDILYIVFSAVVTVGGAFAIRYINAITDSKYKKEITEAVSTAVTYTQQVFVDAAKADNVFDKSYQRKARNMAISEIWSALTPAALKYLRRDRSDSEVNEILITMIEEAVRIQKKKEESK